MRIFAIETSCDETALSLVDASGELSAPRFVIRRNIIASQIKIHRPFGGVVPNLAKREHIKNLPLLLEQLRLREADWQKIDAIAVTVGPGLEPALWTGINFAEALAKSHKKPLWGANHLEGHLFSFLLEKGLTRAKNGQIKGVFPAVGLIASGGHTILLKLDSLKDVIKLGETRDDAVGEAFDKVARLLELQYPGGPEIEKIAKKYSGKSEGLPQFPRPMIHEKNFDFSFSGLKTSVLYFLRDNKNANRAAVAKAFQDAAVETLAAKTFRAAETFGARSVLLSGGVSANKTLRKAFAKEAKRRILGFHVAGFAYNTDNAAIIAASAYINSLRKKKYRLAAQGRLSV